MGEDTMGESGEQGPKDYQGDISSHQAPAVPLSLPSCSVRSHVPWNGRMQLMMELHPPFPVLAERLGLSCVWALCPPFLHQGEIGLEKVVPPLVVAKEKGPMDKLNQMGWGDLIYPRAPAHPSASP